MARTTEPTKIEKATKTAMPSREERRDAATRTTRTRTGSSRAPLAVDAAFAKEIARTGIVEQPIDIRPAGPDDLAYVFQTWLRDFKDAPIPRLMDPRVYNAQQKRVIDRLCCDAAVVIACDPDRSEQILGWACGETWKALERMPEAIAGAIIHYVYVASWARRRRIGRRLLEHLVGAETLAGDFPLFYSHLPEPRFVEGQMLPNIAIKMMGKHALHNPYLAFGR